MHIPYGPTVPLEICVPMEAVTHVHEKPNANMFTAASGVLVKA